MHEFQGRSDRWCTVCNQPDRAPIHQVSNLSKPVKGIHELKLIEKATAQGAKSLLHLLAPEQYMEGTSIAALQMNCIYGLIEQIKLRDTYISLCMKDLGIPPLPEPEEDTYAWFLRTQGNAYADKVLGEENG